MDGFTEKLAEASAAIGSVYFLLPIEGGPSVRRERVYCYELYHQLRERWPPNSDYLLNGELDKSGHPKLGKKLGPLKPDFLIHKPGGSENNYAAIEVKPATPSRKTITKDLKSLSKLRREAKYVRGIYLIYGEMSSSLLRRIRDVAKMEKGGQVIELWEHARPGEAARCLEQLRV